MLKRFAIVSLVLALGLVAQPALAGKKKGPKPYKSESFTIAVAHPVFYGNSGSVNAITAKEFENTCAVPGSNGVDGFVLEIPKEYQKLQASISAVGAAGGAAGYDLDIYMYDANCTPTLASNAAGTDENGVIPKGTAWVFVHNYLGDPGTSAHIELEPY